MEFVERTKAPGKDNGNYYSTKNPDFPKWVNECDWYVVGRLLELGKKVAELKKKLPITKNSENWFNDSTYEKGSIPKLGAVGCYRCGKIHHQADGAGHVFMVEKVYPDLSIDLSESGKNMKFQTRHLKPPYKIYFKSKYVYTFEGFLYPDEYTSKWVVDTYVTLKEKYVRKTPEVKAGNKVKYTSLPNKPLYIKDKSGYAKFKVNDLLYLTEFTIDKKGNTWGKYGNYWLCVEDSTGDQCKKVQ